MVDWKGIKNVEIRREIIHSKFKVPGKLSVSFKTLLLGNELVRWR